MYPLDLKREICLGLLLVEGQISLPRKSYDQGLKNDDGKQPPPKTREESLQYLTYTMKLINLLVDVPAWEISSSRDPSPNEINGRAISMLKGAGAQDTQGIS